MKTELKEKLNELLEKMENLNNKAIQRNSSSFFINSINVIIEEIKLDIELIEDTEFVVIFGDTFFKSILNFEAYINNFIYYYNFDNN